MNTTTTSDLPPFFACQAYAAMRGEEVIEPRIPVSRVRGERATRGRR
jgi:hypothetical protein